MYYFSTLSLGRFSFSICDSKICTNNSLYVHGCESCVQYSARDSYKEQIHNIYLCGDECTLVAVGGSVQEKRNKVKACMQLMQYLLFMLIILYIAAYYVGRKRYACHSIWNAMHF